MGQPLPPPGWYPAPDGRTVWWDGARWVDTPTQLYAQPRPPATAPPGRSRTGRVIALVAGVTLLLCLALGAGAYVLANRGDDSGGRPSDAQAIAAVRRALLPCAGNGIVLSQAEVTDRSGDEAVVRAPGFYRESYTVDFTVSPARTGSRWTVAVDDTGLPSGVDLSCALDEVATD